APRSLLTSAFPPRRREAPGGRGRRSRTPGSRSVPPRGDDLGEVKSKLLRRREFCGITPVQLGNVVGRRGLPREHTRRPVQVERPRRSLALAVPVDPDPGEFERLHLQAGLLTELPAESVERVLALLQKTTRQ